MTPFKKLNFNVELQSVPTDKVLVQHSGSHDKDYFLYTDMLGDSAIAGIKLFSCGAEFDTHIVNQLPKKLTGVEIPKIFFMEIEKESICASFLPPHIDRGRRCAINIYTECNGEETTFYTEDFKSNGSFTATNGDVWLLDVLQPHSVMFKTGAVRQGITLSFRHASFQKVLDALGSDCLC